MQTSPDHAQNCKANQPLTPCPSRELYLFTIAIHNFLHPKKMQRKNNEEQQKTERDRFDRDWIVLLDTPSSELTSWCFTPTRSSQPPSALVPKESRDSFASWLMEFLNIMLVCKTLINIFKFLHKLQILSNLPLDTEGPNAAVSVDSVGWWISCKWVKL